MRLTRRRPPRRVRTRAFTDRLRRVGLWKIYRQLFGVPDYGALPRPRGGATSGCARAVAARVLRARHRTQIRQNGPRCAGARRRWSAAGHQLAMTVLMTPDMANFAGNVHGGTILKLLDQVAYACASRYAGSYVVTLVGRSGACSGSRSMSASWCTFLASVNYTGTTSMEVGIKVITEDIRSRWCVTRTAAFSRWLRLTILAGDGGAGARTGDARRAAAVRGGEECA